MTEGVPRLGIPPELSLDETNTGVASGCYWHDHCATTFGSPASLAASFNKSSWRKKGEVISTEMRANNNLGFDRGFPFSSYKIGLIGFGPNINMVRDPRWGRNDEVPSEDPFLAGSYATQYIKGMQEGEDPRYLKMISNLKHFAAYSVEKNRHSFSANLTKYDLHDTFLDQFRLGFTKGNASGAMCAYSLTKVEGQYDTPIPDCANPYFLTTLIREKWGVPDAVITSDCDAVEDEHGSSHYAPSWAAAVADSLNAGDDINCGYGYSGKPMHQALEQGLTNVSVLDRSVFRAFKIKFRAGQFDPLESQIYTNTSRYGFDQIGIAAHGDVNFHSALQGQVLLRNDDNTVLPLRKGMKVALLGPHIRSQGSLFSGYFGDEVCFSGNDIFNFSKSFHCVRTIEKAMQTVGGGAANVVAMEGVGVLSKNASGIPAAVELARKSDVAVVVLGLNKHVEAEMLDRSTTDLPGIQQQFALDILRSGVKRIVFVFINGGMISFDALLQNTPPSVKLAFVEAFYPGYEGARAIAETLYGQHNRWGRLPVTIYGDSFQHQQNFYDFDMTKPPGRTYKYYTGKPLFEFGHGLSYTTFRVAGCSPSLSSSSVSQDVRHRMDGVSSSSSVMKLNCTVINTGSVDGDEVLLLYHRASDAIIHKHVQRHPFPLKNLMGFERVSIRAKQSATVVFDLRREDFSLTDAEGDKVVYSGIHFVDVKTASSNITTSWNISLKKKTEIVLTKKKH